MGDLEAAKGDDGKAIEEYRAAIALKPSLPNLHYSLGHLLWKDLKVPEARVELEAELALNPRHPGALNDLGDTYLLEHQPNKALPYLVKALAADSGKFRYTPGFRHRILRTRRLPEGGRAIQDRRIRRSRWFGSLQAGEGLPSLGREGEGCA